MPAGGLSKPATMPPGLEDFLKSVPKGAPYVAAIQAGLLVAAAGTRMDRDPEFANYMADMARQFLALIGLRAWRTNPPGEVTFTECRGGGKGPYAASLSNCSAAYLADLGFAKGYQRTWVGAFGGYGDVACDFVIKGLPPYDLLARYYGTPVGVTGISPYKPYIATPVYRPVARTRTPALARPVAAVPTLPQARTPAATHWPSEAGGENRPAPLGLFGGLGYTGVRQTIGGATKPIVQVRTTPTYPDKETKLKMSKPLGRAVFLFNYYTEYQDFVRALAKAVPNGGCKKMAGKDPILQVSRCFRQIDWTKAIYNLVWNEIEDWVYAKMGLPTKEAGLSYGTNAPLNTALSSVMKPLANNLKELDKMGDAKRQEAVDAVVDWYANDEFFRAALSAARVPLSSVPPTLL